MGSSSSRRPTAVFFFFFYPVTSPTRVYDRRRVRVRAPDDVPVSVRPRQRFRAETFSCSLSTNRRVLGIRRLRRNVRHVYKIIY